MFLHSGLQGPDGRVQRISSIRIWFLCSFVRSEMCHKGSELFYTSLHPKPQPEAIQCHPMLSLEEALDPEVRLACPRLWREQLEASSGFSEPELRQYALA